MGNYSPNANPATLYPPSAVPQSVTDGPVTGGDPLEFSPGGAVHRAADHARYAGIAQTDAATGAGVNRFVGYALFTGTAEGAVSAGDDLAASTVAGHQVKTAGTGEQVIGRAQTAAADGAQVRWLQR
jgi:hypothetical protein